MEHRLTSTGDLARLGLGPRQIARLVDQGRLTRVRRGFYRDGPALSAEEHHRLLIASVMADERAHDAVLSHGSAAVVHALPVPRSYLRRVALSRERRGRGHISVALRERGCPLPSGDVVVVDGLTVTSLARTVADLARELPFDWAVAVVDAALARGVERAALVEQVDRSRRWPGNAQARAVVAFGDGRAESPGESRSRAILVRGGLPVPRIQHEIRADGVFVGRADFAWEEDGVLGEFDGLAKYGELARAGESPGQALTREKVREDRFRGLGWLVTRWIWAELSTPDALCERVRRTLALGRERAGRR